MHMQNNSIFFSKRSNVKYTLLNCSVSKNLGKIMGIQVFSGKKKSGSKRVADEFCMNLECGMYS